MPAPDGHAHAGVGEAQRVHGPVDRFEAHDLEDQVGCHVVAVGDHALAQVEQRPRRADGAVVDVCPVPAEATVDPARLVEPVQAGLDLAKQLDHDRHLEDAGGRETPVGVVCVCSIAGQVFHHYTCPARESGQEVVERTIR